MKAEETTETIVMKKIKFLATVSHDKYTTKLYVGKRADPDGILKKYLGKKVLVVVYIFPDAELL